MSLVSDSLKDTKVAKCHDQKQNDNVTAIPGAEQSPKEYQFLAAVNHRRSLLGGFSIEFRHRLRRRGSSIVDSRVAMAVFQKRLVDL